MQGNEARHISVSGVVQGVGFRPFVYNLAHHLGLHGWVLNHSGGVEIVVEGPGPTLDAFLAGLTDEAPPLAHIASVDAKPVEPQGFAHFEIRESAREEGRFQLISPDVATCPDCRHEILDSSDRRHRYPFTNCTNCGPRFTIIADIPYDRPNTTMRVFPMCPACRSEYGDPADRRFHAQPNACPECGPHLWMVDAEGNPLAAGPTQADNEAVLALARDMLLAGEILAIKGLGGFHLACDATNADAVTRLRERKCRPHKPFALMVATLEDVKAHCVVSDTEMALLTSPQCPIVLLQRKVSSTVVDEVAPGNETLGMMLPYTPLHHILLRDVGRPLVMTSGNLSEEPIASENDEALCRLGRLADAFLLHNRDIYSRYDDSVWQVLSITNSRTGETTDHSVPVRRARGYAPFPVKTPVRLDPVLAVGPMLKNTFCLGRDDYAFISQHIGDMENLETLEHFEATVELYEHLFRLKPASVVADRHSDYLSTHFAREYAEERGLTLRPAVQHHKAHVASCLADNGWALAAGPVIGVALDGTGYGEDGRIWGGEWFVGDYAGFRRAAQLEYLPLPGGDAGIRHPWRTAAGYLYALLGREAVFSVSGSHPAGADMLLLMQIIDRGVNTPVTSSMGRLFDAVSALLGICHEASFEAQAAIALEQAATEPAAEACRDYYPFGIESVDGVLQIRLEPLFREMVTELHQPSRQPVSEVAWRFHRTVSEMILQVCTRLRDESDTNVVALSGGCFQSRLLTEMAGASLTEAGFRVLLHRQVPPNDGGISLGQAILSQTQIVERGG